MSTSESPDLEEVQASHLPEKVFESPADIKYVSSIVYFKDGKRIISGSRDKAVRMWNVENLQPEGECLMHDFEVRSIALSPDERTLVSAGMGGGMVLWDLEGRTVIWKKEREDSEEVGEFRVVTYSPNGRLIVASYMKEIVMLDAETGQRIRNPLQFDGNNVGGCDGLAFSPDGTRLAAGSDESGNVRVFDVATGETVVGPFKAHTTYVTSLIYSLDGQQIITASMDRSIRVWDSATGLEVGEPMLEDTHLIFQIALSVDGRRLAAPAVHETVRVWDLTTRRQIGDLITQQAQHKTLFGSVAWSHDGRFLIAAGGAMVSEDPDDDLIGKIHLWDIPPLNDVTPVPVFTQAAGSPQQLASTSPRSRANSLSSSILNLPAGSQPPNQPPSSHILRDDFFNDSTPDLPARAHNQISTIPKDSQVPFRPLIPRTTKAKTAPNTPSRSAPSPSNVLGRIGSHFRRDKHASEAIKMQPQAPPTIPKYSSVGKVALGKADPRLYMDESQDKKRRPGDDGSEQEVLVDVEVGCWGIFCTLITTCCLLRKDPNLDSDDELTTSHRR